VMLGAGFFATQEAQRTVHTGSQQASSSLEIIGNIYGRTTATTEVSTANAHLQYVVFSVGNTAGGAPIDITSMVVTFVCGDKAEVISFDETNSIKDIGSGTSTDETDANTKITAGKWGIINTHNDVGVGRNKLLEPGEQFVVKIAFPDDGKVLKPNTRFSVNLQPAIGAAFPIKKTVPSNLYAVTPV